ncbi:MAG: LamG domain-containing protein [Myxococcota bacterium]
MHSRTRIEWKRSARLCALVFTAALAFGCGEFGGGSGGSSGGGSSGFLNLSAQAGGVEAFEATVYPLVTTYCTTCHAGSGPGSPHFAAPSVSTAYQQITSQGKVNLGNPSASRMVVKLVSFNHHCWPPSCATAGAEMAAAIQAWADAVDFGSGGVSVDGALSSGSQAFSDGIVDTGSERYFGNLIALYEFKEGTGDTAFDTSGVAPAMDLDLRGDAEFLSNWGIIVENGSLRASDAASRKLYDRIADPTNGTQQYTVEAWVTPANIDQTGPARIVSYSRNTNERNFTLGQVEYNYNVRNRNIDPGAQDEGTNGLPALQTEDADRDAQDRLQHVVVTYDQFRGRRIYVDGVFTDDTDPLPASRLWNWDPSYTFVLANERSNNRRWMGQLRLVAVYNQALTDAQIRQNFEAGVGERILMRFDVAQWMGAGASVEFVVTDFDQYSYLFCQPTMRTPAPNGSRISNIQIAVNGDIATSGQGFQTIDTTSSGTRQELSRQCTVVPKGGSGSDDTFTLVFEHLGGFQNVVVEDPVDPAPVILDPDPRPVNGLRDFVRVNEAFARITGQSTDVAAATYDEIAEQLPPDYDVRSFVSSHQVATAKLALEYCDALVEGPDRSTYFPGFNFGQTADLAFDTDGERQQIFDPLYARMVGSNLVMQPTEAEVDAHLLALVNQLTAVCSTPAGCTDPNRTLTVVKGTCAAVLSSAAVTLH